MRFKYIMLLSSFCLAACIVFRFVHLAYAVDASTGFFYDSYKAIGYGLFVAIAAILLLVAVFSNTVRRKPEKQPKVNSYLGCASIFMGISIGYEIINETFVNAIQVWQIVLLDLSGILAAIFFIVYGLKMFIDFNVPEMLTIIAPIYFIIRLICIFTTVSSLSLISDTVVTVLCQSLALVFMLNFAKILNYMDDRKIFRKLLTTGLCASIICLADSIPRICLSLLKPDRILHSVATYPLSTLATGLFIACFTISFFSERNLKSRRHRGKHLSTTSEGFYIPDGKVPNPKNF